MQKKKIKKIYKIVYAEMQFIVLKEKQKKIFGITENKNCKAITYTDCSGEGFGLNQNHHLDFKNNFKL